MSWLGDRWRAARDSLAEDSLKWLIGAGVALAAFAGATALGIETDLVERPDWWPWQPPPQTAEISVPRNRVAGFAGYGFAGPVFDEVERALAGTGALRFTDDRLRDLRVCRNIEIAPAPGARDLLQTFIDRVDPCLTLAESGSPDAPIFEIGPGQAPALQTVQRANRGGTTVIDQHFCDCRAEIVEAFLTQNLP